MLKGGEACACVREYVLAVWLGRECEWETLGWFSDDLLWDASVMLLGVLLL